MKELKPCPFCGAKNPIVNSFEVRKGYEANVQCENCLVYMPSITYDSRQEAENEAIREWNRRAKDE